MLKTHRNWTYSAKIDSMTDNNQTGTQKAVFERIDNNHRTTLTFYFNDRPIPACGGENIAAALLAAGVTTFRHTPVSGQPRGPWCMMGACFDCLVRINGNNVQACMTEVADGLQVRSVEAMSQS